jgi:hypothetical protein
VQRNPGRIEKGIVPTFPAERGTTEAADEGKKIGGKIGDGCKQVWMDKIG